MSRDKDPDGAAGRTKTAGERRMNLPGQLEDTERQKERRREMARVETKGGLFCSWDVWPGRKVPGRSTRCHCNYVKSDFLRTTPLFTLKHL